MSGTRRNVAKRQAATQERAAGQNFSVPKKARMGYDEDELFPDEDRLGDDMEQYEEVFFDLETTSLALKSDITQIGAIGGGKKFDQYILPDQEISPGAAKLTHLQVKDGALLYKGQTVDSVDAKSGLSRFLKFLKAFDKKVILIGHYIRKFDCHVLTHALNKYDMYGEFEKRVVGFVDSLWVMKRVRPKLPRHALQYLTETLLPPQEYEGHNALVDASLVQALFDKVKPSEEDKLAFSFTSGSFLENLSTQR